MEFDDMIMGKMANENAHPNKRGLHSFTKSSMPGFL